MIKHAFTTPVSDDSNPDKVQASDWNAAHVIELVTTDPVAPGVGELWMLATGTTPTRSLQLKFCDEDHVVVILVDITR